MSATAPPQSARHDVAGASRAPGARPGRRPLGRSGIELSELGIGTAGFGNLYAPVPDDAAATVLARAHAAGIRYADTAPWYGFGLSERRVGDAIRAHVDGADRWILSTKVGRLLQPVPSMAARGERHGFVDALPFQPVPDYSGSGIRRSVEDSLQRLGLSRFDVALVHDIGPETHGAAAAAHLRDFWKDGYRTLRELRDEGVIAAIGAGANAWEICAELMQRGDFDCFLLAGRYTLLEQGALESFMPACAARGIGLILGGIFNSGILAAAPDAASQVFYNYLPPPAPVLARVRRLHEVCGRHGVPLAAAALQFVLAHPDVSSVIPGVISVDQLETVLRHRRLPIPTDLWAELKGEGLLPIAAPTPGGDSDAG